jgi:hypothetical protein
MRPVESAATPTLTQISPAISLDEIVAREIPVQWDEAVAVVEELCGMLTAGHELPVPKLIDIRISADGAIALTDGAIGERGARSAGRMLHTLLSAANTPAALRLFVTHATSPDAYGSIRDFAAGLAYFGKPARKPLIRELYGRCAAAGLLSNGDVPRRHVTSGERPSGKSPASEKRARARTRWTRRVIVASGASLAGVAIWFGMSTITARPENTSLPALISEAKSAVRTLQSGVITYLGFRPPDVRGAQDLLSPEVTPSSNRLIKPGRWQGEPQQISSIPLLPAPDQRAVTVVPLVEPLLTIDAPARAETPVETSEVARAIYSSTDADVRPPVLEFPQMPSTVGESRPDLMNRMELVVSADGTVEQVRLVAGPNRMTDMMLLSGAKMWRFQPAVKEGKPVRYRTTVSWIAGP